jgi:ribokinase
LADQVGARFVLNLAPVLSLPRPVLARADPLVVNEHEAAELLGGAPATGPAAAVALAAALARACRSVVVTLGGDGAVWAVGGESGATPAVAARKVVDTTGAGDAFVAALAVVLAQGSNLELAVAYGVVAGSHAVTVPGASPDMPPVEALVAAAEQHAAVNRGTPP